jgi:D-mannonate dehydratase
MLRNEMFQSKGTRVPTIDKMETRKKTTVAKVLETVMPLVEQELITLLEHPSSPPH